MRRALARALADEARRRWLSADDPPRPPSIHVPCERLGPTAELHLDLSDGHGQTLQLVRVRRAPRRTFEITILEYRWDSAAASSPDPWRAEEAGAVVRSGQVPAATVAPHLDAIRAAASLEITPAPDPPVGPDEVPALGFVFTSHDFHGSLTFRDAHGRGRSQSFAGYLTSDTQTRALPMMLAVERMYALLQDPAVAAALSPRDPTPEDRDLFLARFAAARDAQPPYHFWYVRERLLGMAQTLGDARLIPDLLDLAARSGDASLDRGRAGAINALVRITGWDPRYDGEGAPRPVPKVAEELRVACANPSTVRPAAARRGRTGARGE